MANPVVSVSILNYRRRDSLTRTLESVRNQLYPSKEVIVVDNASGDGIEGFLERKYPEVRLIGLHSNVGCGARNHGVEAARGQYVVTLDNDIYFDSPFELQKVVSAFESRPSTSCIVFKVLEANTGQVHLRDWCHPRSYWAYADTEFETSFIAEGACAFRRDDFLRLGGYYEPFWIGCEGWDLALRMCDSGMKILYRPEIRVRHAMASETRATSRNYYFYTRNYLWIAFKDYTGWRRWKYASYHLVMMLWWSVRAGAPGLFLKGIRDGLVGIRRLRRTPISEDGWQRLESIVADRPGLLLRLKKHWDRPQI
jgi:GT2 family glycosyltransferase